MNDIEAIEQRIAALQAELKEAEETRNRLRSMSCVQRLAIMLHAHTCRLNHPDGCPWHYEIRNNIHDWRGDTHKQMLERAKKIEKAFYETGIHEYDIIFNLTKAILSR